MKGYKKALLASLATIGTSCALLGGATFALFTSESKTNIAVTSGKVDVRAVVDEESLVLTSMGEEMDETFATGGTAKYVAETNSFEIDGMVAGDHIEFDIAIENHSTVAVKYQTNISFEGSEKLFEALNFELDGENNFAKVDGTYLSSWTKFEKGEEGYDMHVKMGIPESYQDTIVNGDDTNSIQGKECSIVFNVTAVQGNANTSGLIVKDDTYYVTDEAALEEMIANVNSGENLDANIVLAKDLDFSGEEWTPIGSKEDEIYFSGTFDGNGCTVSGVNINSTEDKYVGFFGAVQNATIKNLTVEGTVSGQDAGGLIGRILGETVVENCVNRVAVTGSTKAGGIACNTNAANVKLINCYNYAPISGGASGIGGLIGYVNNDATLEVINCGNYADITGKYAGAVVGYAAAQSTGFIDGMENTGAINYTSLDTSNSHRYLADGNGVILCGYCTDGNWKLPVEISGSADLTAALAEAKAGDTIALAAGSYEKIDLTKTDAISNLTIVGREGAEVAGFMYSTSHVTNTKGTIDGLTFKNVTFTNTVYIATSSVNSSIKNVTFENCKFNLSGSDWQTNQNAQAIRYYNESNTNGGVQNLVVKDCVFEYCYQGVYTMHAVNVTVTGCTFKNIKHNAIAIQDQAKYEPISHGDVVITNNTFTDVTERPIRFGRLDVDTTLTITGNVAINSKDGSGEIMKSGTLAEDIKQSANISGNDWNGTGEDGVELIIIG